MNWNKKVVSIDAETNGLWGKPFAIAAVVYIYDGEVARFVARCPIKEEINPWVKDNVLPQMEAMPITHNSLEEMYADFAKFWLEHKDGAAICHMGQIVEANIFRELHNRGLIGDWDAPYKWFDVCVLPGVEDSVDGYAKTHGIKLPEMAGGSHNPLYDCIITAITYLHWVETHNKEEKMNNTVWVNGDCFDRGLILKNLKAFFASDGKDGSSYVLKAAPIYLDKYSDDCEVAQLARAYVQEKARQHKAWEADEKARREAAMRSNPYYWRE